MGNGELTRLDEMQADIFKALGHPIRLQIVRHLEKGERTVSEIVRAVGAEQSNVSRHLAVLKQCGVLLSRKEGLRVFYSLRSAEFWKAMAQMCGCVQGLARQGREADKSTLADAGEGERVPATPAGGE